MNQAERDKEAAQASEATAIAKAESERRLKQKLSLNWLLNKTVDG